MVPVHRKQRILCLCSWLPAGAALTGSLAATITSCVAQGTGIRPPPRRENRNLKKNHRNNARGREVQAGWEGRVTSHTQTPRLCWGWQGPLDPAWNSSPSGAFGASSMWRAERQRSAIPSLPELLDPRSWHSRDIRPPLEPRAALAPERLQPGPVGRGQRRARSSRVLVPSQGPALGRAEEAGGRPRSSRWGPSALPVHSRRDCAALPTR